MTPEWLFYVNFAYCVDDLNAPNAKYGGLPPLHQAVASNNVAFTHQLLALGADPDVRDSFGNTVLFRLCDSQYWRLTCCQAIYRALLVAGANAMAENADGVSTVEQAYANAKWGISEMWRELDASLNLRVKANAKYPAELSMRRRHSNFQQLSKRLRQSRNEIEKWRARICDWCRPRIVEIAVALCWLPALLVVEIMDRSVACAFALSMHYKWQIVAAAKKKMNSNNSMLLYTIEQPCHAASTPESDNRWCAVQ